MAYQWIHIEAVSKAGRDIYSTINGKRVKVGHISVESILGEAGRLEGYTSHIENTLPPVIIFGDEEKGIEDVRQKFEDWQSGTKDARCHKVRIDANSILSGVVSWPPISDDEDEKSYKDKMNAFEIELINYLRMKYGEDLILVLRHDDEPFKGKNEGKIHYHWHFFCVKKPGEKFDLHPGFLVRSKFNVSRKDREKMNHKEIKKIYEDGYKAYNEAMKEFQNEFHYNLGRRFNLERKGPMRLRRSRYEQVELENYVEKELEYPKTVMNEALKLKEEADNILKDAENIRIKAEEEAKSIKENAWVEASDIIKAANEKAERIINEAEEIKQDAKNIKDNAWVEASDITNVAKKQADEITKEAKRIADEKKANVDELLSIAKKDADEIIHKANQIANEVKSNAWAVASDIKKDAEEEAEHIVNEEKNKADKLVYDAKKYATKIINKAESFINDLLVKISKLSGGDIVVKWAKNTIKSITEPNKKSKSPGR
jgi:cell division septum initiation protein DivIVA